MRSLHLRDCILLHLIQKLCEYLLEKYSETENPDIFLYLVQAILFKNFDVIQYLIQIPQIKNYGKLQIFDYEISEIYLDITEIKDSLKIVYDAGFILSDNLLNILHK